MTENNTALLDTLGDFEFDAARPAGQVDVVGTEANDELKAAADTLRQVLERASGGTSGVREGQLIRSSTAGRIAVWNRETGVQSLINSDQIKAVGQTRFPSGHPMARERVYTTTPMEPVAKGTHLCRLHPDHPDRARLDAMGLRGRVCRKQGIPSEFDADMHLRLKHKNAFQIIKEDEVRQEREEYRQMQRDTQEMMQAQSQALLALAEQVAAMQGGTARTARTPKAPKAED